MSEEQIKEEIEQIGYQEFYRYYQEAGILVEQQKQEIERLKQGYCELKEKCNKGECDCTHEEYNGMCEANIKMDLEIERLNNIIDEADTKNLELIQKINKIYDVIENKNITGIEARLLIQDILDKEE